MSNHKSQFDNKIILITGSTQGIGAETALLFATRGAEGIVICGRNEKNGNDIKNQIISNNGSVQNISKIPKGLKDKYKIVWEIPMKNILEMAADRGAYICQSQSTNLWMKEPTYNKLTAMHFFSWKKSQRFPRIIILGNFEKLFLEISKFILEKRV